MRNPRISIRIELPLNLVEALVAHRGSIVSAVESAILQCTSALQRREWEADERTFEDRYQERQAQLLREGRTAHRRMRAIVADRYGKVRGARKQTAQLEAMRQVAADSGKTFSQIDHLIRLHRAHLWPLRKGRRDREILFRFLDGHTNAETARLVGVSGNTVTKVIREWRSEALRRGVSVLTFRDPEVRKSLAARNDKPSTTVIDWEAIKAAGDQSRPSSTVGLKHDHMGFQFRPAGGNGPAGTLGARRRGLGYHPALAPPSLKVRST